MRLRAMHFSTVLIVMLGLMIFVAGCGTGTVANETSFESSPETPEVGEQAPESSVVTPHVDGDPLPDYEALSDPAQE